MSTDLLTDATWQCASSTPGAVVTPGELDGADLAWIAAEVPGTAAGALRAAGQWSWGIDDEALLDGRDWWFRCLVAVPDDAPGPFELRLGGLATIADVWLDGRLVLHSENMFCAHSVAVERLEGTAELVIRCAALAPLLAARHPRPRWKSLSVRTQALRWYRTALLGRMPGWSRWAAAVGPWRPIELLAHADRPVVRERRLQVRCDGTGGQVELRARIDCRDGQPARALLRVGDEVGPLRIETDGDDVIVSGDLRLASVERWWPHSHGEPRRYPVTVELDGIALELGSVGFRTVEAERDGDGFALKINGVPVFARGACWGALDAVSFVSQPEEVRAAVSAVRDAGMNMLRVPGYTCYEGAAFWDACDELGVLVWQDCMLASVDPPEEPQFVAGIRCELEQVFGALQGRPSLTVVCGGSESYQQAAMYGLPPERWYSTLLEETIPSVLGPLLPGVPYLPSSPSGGALPFDPAGGVSHYFGIGAFMRPLGDARRANVRFASECLPFATPPEPETVAEFFGDGRAAGHDPRWKATVARDAGMSWDYEDVRDHYVATLFRVDPLALRYRDPERALDFGRAAVAEAMSATMGEWRREASSCAGAIVLTLRDLWPGAGWGLLDALGRPKAPWFALARACAARTVLVSDEGLSGLVVHLVNDPSTTLAGTLRVSVFAADGTPLESAAIPVEVPAHGQLELSSHRIFGGFRDLTDAYRFGPATNDVVLVELHDAQGATIADTVYLPAGAGRPLLPEVGLQAELTQHSAELWSLRISTRLFAQYVAIDLPGFRASDSWFHLAPGHSRTVSLHAVRDAAVPVGTVRALNSLQRARLTPQTGPR